MEKTKEIQLEKKLLTNLLVNKQNFQEAIYDHTFSLVYTIVKSWYPNEVDDIVNDIFVNKLFSIELEKYESIGDNLEGYIAITVRHYCRDLWKAKKKKADLHQQLSLEQHTFPNQSVLDLTVYLEQLTDLQAKAIKLRYYQNLTYFEIQQALQLSSESAVRQHVSRGIKKLKEMLSP